MHTHEELHAKTLDAARREKSATLELLRFLKLVEEKRTFAVLGYPSLFKYVEEGLGYSPAQASERVSAMRLLRQVPEVAEKLSEGAHSLTSISLSEVFLSAMGEFIKKRELKEKEPKAKETRAKEKSSSTSVTEVNSQENASATSVTELRGSKNIPIQSAPHCPAHNRLSAIHAYGANKMRPFFKNARP